MTGRGWSAKDLPLVGDDPEFWTIAHAAALLRPPGLTAGEAAALVQALRLQARRLRPVGKRRTVAAGKPGRCARVYKAIDLIEAYEKIS